jgi:hypothetical protein
MEGPCAQLCTMSSSQCGWPNGPSLAMVPIGLRCMLCEQVSRVATMLICDKCSQGWHMGCLMPPMIEMSVGKWFCP